MKFHVLNKKCQQRFVVSNFFLGSIGGQLLNGAEGGGETTASSNIGNAICDNNTTTNNHPNNRTVTGQNTPDGKTSS